jgi:hypothetical protein
MGPAAAALLAAAGAVLLSLAPGFGEAAFAAATVVVDGVESAAIGIFGFAESAASAGMGAAASCPQTDCA